MTSENELLNALVKTLPFVKDLEEELTFYKKELKHEKKSAKKWKKKHDALMQILYDYPCLMRASDSQPIPVRVPMNKCTIDLTQDDDTVSEEDVNTPIIFSSDISAIKKEKIIKIEVDETLKNDIAMIVETDSGSELEEGEILELEINENLMECTSNEPVVQKEEVEKVEEMEVEVEEETKEEEGVRVRVEEEEEQEEEEEEEMEEEVEAEVEAEVVEEEEEEMEVEEEEEEEELMEFDIGDKTYLVTDETNGTIYDYINEEDVGDELGVLKNGIPKWHKK